MSLGSSRGSLFLVLLGILTNRSDISLLDIGHPNASLASISRCRFSHISLILFDRQRNSSVIIARITIRNAETVEMIGRRDASMPKKNILALQIIVAVHHNLAEF